jgi:hypothetical protein
MAGRQGIRVAIFRAVADRCRKSRTASFTAIWATDSFASGPVRFRGFSACRCRMTLTMTLDEDRLREFLVGVSPGARGRST